MPGRPWRSPARQGRSLEPFLLDAANDRSRDACSPGRAGSNAGGSIKVEACAQSNGAIELFLPMGYAIEPGDAFAIHPGCDKRLDTCIARFANVLNFRGEPYVPGQDALMSYPDAR